MTMRNQWQFDIRGQDIAGACKRKLAHHKTQHQFWHKKRHDILKLMRLRGITVDESAPDLTQDAENYHERLRWWEEQKLLVANAMRAENITVNDTIADFMKSAFTLDRELAETSRKQCIEDLSIVEKQLDYYTDKIETYATWINLLSSAESFKLQITYDDWVFFFGPDKITKVMLHIDKLKTTEKPQPTKAAEPHIRPIRPEAPRPPTSVPTQAPAMAAPAGNLHNMQSLQTFLDESRTRREAGIQDNDEEIEEPPKRHENVADQIPKVVSRASNASPDMPKFVHRNGSNDY